MTTSIAIWMNCKDCGEIVCPKFVSITIKDDTVKIQAVCPQCVNPLKEEITLWFPKV